MVASNDFLASSTQRAIILTPFAILFTYKATNDLGISIDFDWLINPIQKKITQINNYKNKRSKHTN